MAVRVPVFVPVFPTLQGRAIDARSRLAFEREVGLPEPIDIHMVQERGEPFLLLQPRGLP
jgi:hypothetical protein